MVSDLAAIASAWEARLRGAGGARLALAVLLLAALWGGSTILAGQRALRAHIVDSYYYFEAARSVAEGRAADIGWEQGPRDKYFPGYGCLLGVVSAATGHAPHVVWGPVQLALYVALLAALVGAFRAAGMGRRGACLAAALVAGNAVVVRWSAVAMSDLLAVACLAAQAALLGAPSRARPRVAAFCVLAGLGVATRVEAAFFQPALLVFDVRHHRLLARNPARLAAWAVVGLAPLAAWIVWARPADGKLHYVGEGADHLTPLGVWQALATLMATVIRPQVWDVATTSFLAYLAYRLAAAFWLALLFLAPTGALGPRARWCWLLLWAYWLAHALWYYQTERYNLFVVPLAAVILVDGCRWYARVWSRRAARGDATDGDDAGRPRREGFAALLVALLLLIQTQSFVSIDDHVRHLNEATPDVVWAGLGARAPFDDPDQLVVTNAAVGAAYHLPARVVFSYEWPAWWGAWAASHQDGEALAGHVARLAAEGTAVLLLLDERGKEDARLEDAALALLGRPDGLPAGVRVATIDRRDRLAWRTQLPDDGTR